MTQATATQTRRRRTPEERAALEARAYDRAAHGQSTANYERIIEGFVERGIPEDEIQPRENIFTYHAWRKLGRQVKRGEKGLKVISYTRDEKTDELIPVTAHVFHVSQTKAISE